MTIDEAIDRLKQMPKENICCPYLEVLPCGDTDNHKHFFCDSAHTVTTAIPTHLTSLISNAWVISHCLGDFKTCEFYPNKG